MFSNRWLPALFCLWILVISYRYINTVVRGFQSPFSYGNDVAWFAIWLATAIVTIIVAVRIKRSVQIVYAILIAVCGLILFLSGTLMAGLAAAALLVAAYAVGKWLLFVLGVQPDLIMAVPVGLVILALGGFALAAWHILTTLAVLVLLASCTALSALKLRSQKPVWGRKIDALSLTDGEIRFPLLLIAPVIFLNLAWAVAPEIQFDANNYHLAVPLIYLRNHGFMDLPYFFHSYFYRLVEMVFTFAVALNGAPAAKLLVFAFSLLACAAVFSLGRLVFDDRIGSWAAAFFYTTPIVSWLAGTAYIDNVVAMFITVTMIAFLRWRRQEGQTGWLYVASLLAGASIATKVNAAFAFPVLFAVVLWGLRRKPVSIAACVLLALAVALPWYGLTYLWTDNPVLPMLNGIFKSPLWAFENRVMDANNYGIGASPAAISRLPFSLTWNTVRFGTATPRGAAGSTLLFTFPFAVALIAARKQGATILFITATLFFLLWAVSFQNIRYYVHILPVVCVLGVATVFQFSHDRWIARLLRTVLAVVLIVQFLPTSMLYAIPDRFPVNVAFGLEAREEFLKRALRIYGGTKHVNGVLRPGERVLGVDVEDARFYLDAQLETLADSTSNTVLRAASSLSGEKLLYTLTQSGFAYVFATRDSLKNPPIWLPYIKRDFLDHCATLIYGDENTVVYRLKR